MSENLKRAESLFNRIMNQSTDTLQTKGGLGLNGGDGISPSKKSNQHQFHNNHVLNNNHGNNRHHHSSHHNHHSAHGSHHKSFKLHSWNSINQANVDLPKSDPVKVAKETLSTIPSEHHVLPYCWTSWHHSRTKIKKDESDESISDESNPSSSINAVAVDSYLQTTQKIEFPSISNPGLATVNIVTIEQLWMSLASIKRAYDIPVRSELLVFKSGINPVWEDPINSKGGRWIFRFNRRPQTGNYVTDESVLKVRRRTTLIWERLILKTLTGSLFPDSDYSEEIQNQILNDISGLVLSVRKDDDIISVWNSNLNFSKRKDDSKKLTPFQARRIICDAILRVIRECDLVSNGSHGVDAVDLGSNERVLGVTFEYRLHSDANNTSERYPRRHKHYQTK